MSTDAATRTDAGRTEPLRAAGRVLYRFRGVVPVPAAAFLVLFASPTEFSFLAGAAVACLGEAGRLWALTYIGPKSRAEGKRRADRLITEGPYSLTRNPLYVANLTIAAGLFLAANRWILLLAVPLGFAYYYLVALAEEEFLRGAFADAFEEYRRRVPRFVPRIGAMDPAAVRFRLREVFTPEISTLLASEAVLVVVGLRLFVPFFSLGGEAFRYFP